MTLLVVTENILHCFGHKCFLRLQKAVDFVFDVVFVVVVVVVVIVVVNIV